MTHRNSLNHDLPYETFRDLIETVRPFYVTLNGLGEPLLHKDIGKMLELCRERGITTSMPCNLSVPQVLTTTILRSPPSIITFSLHGATRETFEAISRQARFDRCIATLRQFLHKVDRSRTRVKVLCAVQAKNLMEYREMFRLLQDLGLEREVSVVPVFDYNGNGVDEERRVVPTAEEKRGALDMLDRDIASVEDERERHFLKRWRRAINKIQSNDSEGTTNSAPCLIPWFSSYITSEGNVLPCCYLTDEHHVMGNIGTTSFAAIWNSPAYRAFRKALREERSCLAGCNYCSRNDAARLKKYGFIFSWTTKWPR